MSFWRGFGWKVARIFFWEGFKDTSFATIQMRELPRLYCIVPDALRSAPFGAIHLWVGRGIIPGVAFSGIFYENVKSWWYQKSGKKKSTDKKTVLVICSQLNAFRSMRMKTPEECCSDPHGGPQLVNNYRPPLPLGNRVLRECGAMWDGRNSPLAPPPPQPNFITM